MSYFDNNLKLQLKIHKIIIIYIFLNQIDGESLGLFC